VTANSETGVTLCVDSEFLLPFLDKLELELFRATAKDLVKLLSRLRRLRSLSVYEMKTFFDMAVMKALPKTLERLETIVYSDDQLAILGDLSIIKDLDLTFIRSAAGSKLPAWSKLLPLVSCLKELCMTLWFDYDEDFCKFIASMKGLESLDIFIWQGGNWDRVLQAIANLELLESLKLQWEFCTKTGLLLLAKDL